MKSSFGGIGHTANYWYICDYFGDSNYKVRAQIFIDSNDQFINAFEREIRGETFRSPEDFSRRFEAFKSSQGQHINGWADAKIRITTDGDAGVAISKLQGSQEGNKGRNNGYGSVYNAELEVEAFTNILTFGIELYRNIIIINDIVLPLQGASHNAQFPRALPWAM